jgi:hypothetical protein
MLGAELSDASALGAVLPDAAGGLLGAELVVVQPSRSRAAIAGGAAPRIVRPSRSTMSRPSIGAPID